MNTLKPSDSLVLVRSDHRQGAAAARTVKKLARQWLDFLRLNHVELSVVITTDRRIRRINRDWRDKDEATDVLSFETATGPSTPGRRPLGDVVISLDTARRRAKAEKHPVTPELARYLAHGLLHLLGYDHLEARQAKRMARAEAKLLGAAGMVEQAWFANR